MAFEHSNTNERAHTIRSVTESEAAPLTRPLHFDTRYTLPVHQEKRLQHQNCHERDRNIHFYEKPHVYAVNGRAVDTSVSSLTHDYIKPFNGHNAIGTNRTTHETTNANYWICVSYNYSFNVKPARCITAFRNPCVALAPKKL